MELPRLLYDVSYVGDGVAVPVGLGVEEAVVNDQAELVGVGLRD